jgi:hypothetical protein
MKYTVKISGGFSGIPMEYQGEIRMDKEHTAHLMHLLRQKRPEGNPDLRDALNYTITLSERGEELSAAFDESQLPPGLRQFLEKVRRQTRT